MTGKNIAPLPNKAVEDSAKAQLPEGAHMAASGKVAIHTAATVFALLLASQAEEQRAAARRGGLQVQDVEMALSDTGFAHLNEGVEAQRKRER
jgi:hypothetical protein